MSRAFEVDWMGTLEEGPVFRAAREFGVTEPLGIGPGPEAVASGQRQQVARGSHASAPTAVAPAGPRPSRTAPRRVRPPCAQPSRRGVSRGPSVAPARRWRAPVGAAVVLRPGFRPVRVGTPADRDSTFPGGEAHQVRGKPTVVRGAATYEPADAREPSKRNRPWRSSPTDRDTTARSPRARACHQHNHEDDDGARARGPSVEDATASDLQRSRRSLGEQASPSGTGSANRPGDLRGNLMAPGAREDHAPRAGPFALGKEGMVTVIQGADGDTPRGPSEFALGRRCSRSRSSCTDVGMSVGEGEARLTLFLRTSARSGRLRPGRGARRNG